MQPGLYNTLQQRRYNKVFAYSQDSDRSGIRSQDVVTDPWILWWVCSQTVTVMAIVTFHP